MTAASNPHMISFSKKASESAAVAVLLVGGLALAGWFFGIEALKSGLPGLVAMNPVTALAFILSGASLGLLGLKQAGPWAGRIGKACASIAALIGLIKLGGYLIGLDIGLDQIFFREKLESQGFYPNRMAPNTALNFFLLGSALLLLDLQTPRRGRRPAQYLTLLATLVSLLALTGYAYGLKPLYGFSSYIPMALNTALGFAVLCAGVLFARPDKGWMAVITSDNAGGMLARRLLPAVIGIPMILGWVRLAGERAGLYGTEFGVSLTALMSIILLAIVVWWSSAALNRTDAERKRAEENLKNYSSQLEAVNKELEAFSYSVSHDLRAPLRHIDGFSQILLEDYTGKLDDEGRRHLHRVREASQQMARLIDDLLNLSRITRAEMRRETVDLSRMAEEAVKRLKNTQPDRAAEIVIEKGLTAEGDERLLRVALDNLLGNAWKYTGKRPQARIEFGRTNHDNRAAYFVRDNGAGFDMAYVHKLFGAFQRLHSMSEFPGTGIGLATVQRIVHRHGGQVWADGAMDKGATFYFTL